MALAPLGATLSIAAVDRRSGEMGVAVLSQSFSAGSRIVWSEPGVGVVVAQGDGSTYGPLGLALLKGGKTPPHALKSLLATDPRPKVRQVMIVDSKGHGAAHTGKSCLPESGYLAGRGFCVQASFVGAKSVWRSMAAAYRASRGALAERLLSALEAGEQTRRRKPRGGPFRSGSLLVIGTSSTGSLGDGRSVDLRVESSDTPLKDLRTMLRVEEGYAHAAAGDELLSEGDVERAEREFSRALSLAPDFGELRLLFALGLLRQGERKRGEALLRGVVGKEWRTLLREMASQGIVEAAAVKKAPGKRA